MTFTTNVTRGGLMVAAVAVTAVLLARLVSGGTMFSPGSLSAADDSGEVLGGVSSHAALGRRCSACHASLIGGKPMSVQCLDCHADTRADLRDSTTLHGGLDNARECLACHTEHRGPTASLVRSGAGVGDHERFGFSLTAHRQTDGGSPFRCGDCHGGSTFKFDTARCESCHRDYQAKFVATHVQAWGSACMACHDGTDRFSRGRFRHDTAGFKLLGAHQPTACIACHVDVRTLAGFKAAPTECVSCHRKDDEHKGEFGNGCGTCHTVDAWKPATFDHKASADCVSCHRKDDEHRGQFGTNCGSCHTVKAWTPATFDHKASTDCMSCHQKDDKHKGRFGTNCGSCHTVKAWTPATFDHKASTDCVSCHRKDDEHRGQFGTDCGSCHTVKAWTPATFDHKASSDCASCHRKDDEHRGEFGTDCGACHTVKAWKPATLDHTFPIDHGEGGRVACKVCHEPGRPYREYTCYGCHEHTLQRIQRKHQEEGISGARLNDCVRCHRTGREHEGGGRDDGGHDD